MEHFSYKGGCGVCERTHIETFKRRAGLSIDKWLWVISNAMLFKTVILATKKLKNKAVFILKQYCISGYVILRSIF